MANCLSSVGWSGTCAKQDVGRVSAESSTIVMVSCNRAVA